MTLLFELTMPNVGSWNGKWTGANRRHLLVRKLSNTQANIERATTLAKNYHYSWGDGWGANVSCQVIEPKSARYFQKLSDGFCGYDWMVDSILERGKILADHEITPKAEVCGCPSVACPIHGLPNGSASGGW